MMISHCHCYVYIVYSILTYFSFKKGEHTSR